MEYRLIGTQKMNFKGSDGNQVEGTRCFFVRQVPGDPNISGEVCDPIFVSAARAARMDELRVGHSYNIEWNRFGKADTIKLLK